ncbi:MAG: MurR/RpiR family transcriptional regulator [Ruminococcaceae bacterium]|nr:MurR/RpiR family transcriptional regulator [Oscillospiraceae bacterium]
MKNVSKTGDNMVIAKIHNVFKNLTDTEQKIASYILEFPQKIVNMTAKELASACGTVPSAVNRMCKSIGVEGFLKLKILLATAVGKEEYNENNIPFDKEDNPKMIFNKVFNSGINTLKNTYQMIDFSKIDEITKRFATAKRIFIFGVGTSSVVAVDAAYRFSQLDVQAYAYTDILQMNVMANNMKNGDVAFGISHSGRTKAVVDAMRSAKQAGATTIALTSFTKSLLYTESDYSISVYADEENYPVEAVSARIAHMCVIDALMLSIASLNYDDYLKHISLRNAALDGIRY